MTLSCGNQLMWTAYLASLFMFRMLCIPMILYIIYSTSYCISYCYIYIYIYCLPTIVSDDITLGAQVPNPSIQRRRRRRRFRRISLMTSQIIVRMALFNHIDTVFKSLMLTWLDSSFGSFLFFHLLIRLKFLGWPIVVYNTFVKRLKLELQLIQFSIYS